MAFGGVELGCVKAAEAELLAHADIEAQVDTRPKGVGVDDFFDRGAVGVEVGFGRDGQFFKAGALDEGGKAQVEEQALPGFDCLVGVEFAEFGGEAGAGFGRGRDFLGFVIELGDFGGQEVAAPVFAFGFFNEALSFFGVFYPA